MAIKEKFQEFIQNIKEKLNPEPKYLEGEQPIIIRLVKDGQMYSMSSGDTGVKQSENYSLFVSYLLNYNFETVCDMQNKTITFYFVPQKNDIKTN